MEHADEPVSADVSGLELPPIRRCIRKSLSRLIDGSPRVADQSTSKHALITGGAGFIGSHLAELLLARDYRVTVVDDESTGTADNLAAVREHFNFTFVHGDVADKALVRDAGRHVDEVYHLAAAVGVQLIADAPIHTIEPTSTRSS